MRILPPLLAAIGVLAMSAAIVGGGGHIAGREASVEVEPFELDETDMPEEAAPGAEVPADAGRLRGAPEERGEGELERVEPRAPLSDLALAVPPKPGVPEPTLPHNPVAVAAGRIEASGHTVVLPGIRVVEADEECRAADGTTWRCGMIARTAFRAWLRGRALRCTVAEPPSGELETTSCTLGKQDVALWLVETGFAEALPDGDYAEAGEAAKREKRGIFGTSPRQ